MANQVYNNFRKLLSSGEINLGAVTGMLMLVGGGYTFSHNHVHTGFITSEIQSTGYSPGGKKISNTVLHTDSVNNRVVWSGSPVIFSGITANVTYGIIYISGSNVEGNYLLGQEDFGEQVVVNSDFTVQWNSAGIYIIN